MKRRKKKKDENVIKIIRKISWPSPFVVVKSAVSTFVVSALLSICFSLIGYGVTQLVL